MKVDSAQAFEKFWNSTLSARSDFEEQHNHGVAKAARKATEFAASASISLSDITPFLDIVKDVGAPYAGMAIGTIAFVFTV